MVHKIFFAFLMLLSGACGGFVLMSTSQTVTQQWQSYGLKGAAVMLLLVFIGLAIKVWNTDEHAAM